METRTFPLQQIVADLSLGIACGAVSAEKFVSGGYVSDLLSDVMGGAKKGNIWVTLQGHPNIVAVAVLKKLAAVVLINGRIPDSDTIEKAEKEGVVILTSDLPAFELVGCMYAMGISGMN